MTQVVNATRKSVKYANYSIALVISAVLVFFGLGSGNSGNSSLFSDKVFAGHADNSQCWCGSNADYQSGSFFAQTAHGDDDSGDSGNSCICSGFLDFTGDDDGGCP